MLIDFAARADQVRANIKSMEQQITAAKRSGDLEFAKELKGEIEHCGACLVILERLGAESRLLEMRARSLLTPYKDIVSFQ